jgi:hypothetical protein
MVETTSVIAAPKADYPMQASQRLAELVHSKHQVLLNLREIGVRQANLVASGDTNSLLKLLAEKQQLIVALQKLELELTPHYEQDPDRRIWASQQARATCAQQAAECNRLLGEILNLEKASAERMTIRRNEVAVRLEQVHAVAQVRSAYEAQRRTPA